MRKSEIINVRPGSFEQYALFLSTGEIPVHTKELAGILQFTTSLCLSPHRSTKVLYRLA